MPPGGVLTVRLKPSALDSYLTLEHGDSLNTPMRGEEGIVSIFWIFSSRTAPAQSQGRLATGDHDDEGRGAEPVPRQPLQRCCSELIFLTRANCPAGLIAR